MQEAVTAEAGACWRRQICTHTRLKTPCAIKAVSSRWQARGLVSSCCHPTVWEITNGMHKPSFASLTVLHYFAGTSHPPIKIRSPILDVHLHPRFGLTWNLVADFGILGSTILVVVTHGTTDVQHTIYHDRTVTIYPGIPFFNPLACSFIVVLVVLTSTSRSTFYLGGRV